MSRVGSRSLNGGTVVPPHCRAQQHVKIPELSWHRLRWVVVGRPVEPQNHYAAKHSRVYTSKDVDIKHRSASCKAHTLHSVQLTSQGALTQTYSFELKTSELLLLPCATCVRRLSTSKSLGSHRGGPVGSGSTLRPPDNGFRRLRKARFRTTTFGRWKGVQGPALGAAMVWPCHASLRRRHVEAGPSGQVYFGCLRRETSWPKGRLAGYGEMGNCSGESG